ncbi:beta-galactosidase, partial [Candidatus Poribacteria bacterium]|nr:beta-galactosidase [Candidatus Poribacteria bacterium]
LFDNAIERLGKNGISTVLCTPTATPPRWLTMKHPEILRVNADGIKMEHGSRQHCCHSSPIFRQYSRNITIAMAEHYKDNPNIVGWQTDNEFNCHFSECHCDACQVGFQDFLKNKYGEISKLNKAWGTSFWSQTYSSFDEVLTPRPGKPTYVNPAHQLEYFRYLSYSVTIFQHDQVEILRKINPTWFIFHNGIFSHIDYRGLFTQDLDVLGFDSYPFFSYDSFQRRFSHAFNLDRARAWSGNFIIPEQQSGSGGQRDYFHDNPEPGEIRRMTYISIARGADSLMYFRWRTCRFGAEEYWCGILDHDNIPRRRYNEIKQIGEELTRVGPEILGTSVKVEVAVAACDIDNIDAHIPLHLGTPDPNSVAEGIHRYFYERGFAVGCVHPYDDLSGLKLYIIPHWVIIKPEWIPKLKQFAESGGILIIGARTGTRDINNNVIAETPPGLLTDLCGATIEEYGKCNDQKNRPLYIRFGNEETPAQIWYEVLQPKTAQIIATWNGRHINGMPAITSQCIGKGQVIYIGTYMVHQLIHQIFPVWIENAGLKPIL